MSDSNPPTLVQYLLFGANPGRAVGILYGFILVAAVFIASVSLIAMFCIWWERKVAGHIQSRLGPNRVGPIGLLQSIADGGKLLLKEDLIPAAADHPLFRLAPYLAFVPVFAAFLALPFRADLVFEPHIGAGVFFVSAILSVEVLGIILAGWASGSKWSVYGAMRQACQMVSYEIPLGMSILVAVMTAGSLDLVRLGMLQGGGLHTWLIFRNPFVCAASLTYFIASLASNKRAPFDLPESESELVAGYHTEYSGLRFSFFFFAEYAAMFVVCAVQATLFLGAWNDPFGLIGYLYHRADVNLIANPTRPAAAIVFAIDLLGMGIFIAKVLILIFVQMWLRWTLPRPRIDQVLYACVKVLLPLSTVLLLGAAIWQTLIPDRLGVPWADYMPFASMAWTSAPGGDAIVALITQIILAILGAGGFLAILGWIGYSAVTGRGIVQRLTPADPIVLPQHPLAPTMVTR